MQIAVDTIDVLVRRNTYKNPCTEGVPDYDKKVVQYMLDTVNCKPPYLNSNATLDPCSKQEQLQMLTMLFNNASVTGNIGKFHTVMPPCRSLERISMDFIDVETTQKSMKNKSFMNESVGVFLNFKEWTYKEVRSMRGMDTQALIGKHLI